METCRRKQQTLKYIMHHLLLTPWHFFTLWINQLQQWTSSVPSTKLSNSMARS